MTVMIIKICGIKSLDMALAAIEAGADMLGFNFYPPSSRYIEVESCARIVAGLKAAEKSVINVGVFVNEDPQQVRKILDTCGLDLAQLSGDEPRVDLSVLNGRAFKAVRPNSLVEADEQLEMFGCAQPPALLVDAHIKGAYGGTGETGDWAIAKYVAAQAPILLAGGLNPENVAAAVRAVNPWGVDVASGVESSPGVKDPSKISAFIAAARLGIT
jgi:phosphoribosylanthranilate isomerase